MSEYAKDVLVTTEWVADHGKDAGVRVVEVDVDTAAYEEGHIEGAVGWNWDTQLCDGITRDITPKDQFEALLGASGIDNDTQVVLYGDNNNWFAAWAYWQLKIYGHNQIKLVNGGRQKWVAEGRPLTTDVPSAEAKVYQASDPDLSIRAFYPLVEDTRQAANGALVDVRSPDEFTGRIIAPPGLPETAQRAGHIPGAASIPWGQAMNEDHTFKSAEKLKELYEGNGITADKNVIAYCRIGERSSHTWFVLNELLGYPHVRNYDGSWTEWGNIVGAAISNPSKA